MLACKFIAKAWRLAALPILLTSACGPRPGPVVPPSGAGGGGEPVPGACDVHLATLEDYSSLPGSSSGVRPNGHPRERPAFVSRRSLDAPPATSAVGGRHEQQGLLLTFGQRSEFLWGKLLSHCERDEVESLAYFHDGSLAVTTSYRIEGELRTDLLAFSSTGSLLWRHNLRSFPCPGSCLDTSHSSLAIDPGDGSAIVAVSDHDPHVTLLRVSAHGERLLERRLTSAQLELDASSGPSSIATYAFGGRSSDIALAFRDGMAVLRPDFSRRFTRRIDALGFGSSAQATEVGICSSDRYLMATVGVEHHGAEHVVGMFDRSGRRLWSLRVAGDRDDRSPHYAGPPGLLRGERYNLRCSEQDVPELLMIAIGEGGAERSSELRGVTFLNDGRVHQHFSGQLPRPDFHTGTAGVGVGAPRLLSLREGKFRVLSPEDVGWMRRDTAP